MARPNSKYFLPVIKKLKAERAAENIFVDEKFKQELKVQLMQKFFPHSEFNTSSKDQPTQENFDHPLDEKFSFGDFFKKWRFPIAVVPSFLLLTVVAVKFFTLPVPISSDEKVPVFNKSSQQSGTVVSTSSESVKKVRTFDGSQILARVQEKSAQEVNELTFTNDSFDTNNSEVKESENPVQKTTTPSQTTQKVSVESPKTVSQSEPKVSQNEALSQKTSSDDVDSSKLAGDVDNVPFVEDTSNADQQKTADFSQNESLVSNTDTNEPSPLQDISNSVTPFSQPEVVVPPVQKLLNTSVPVTQQVVPKVDLAPKVQIVSPEISPVSTGSALTVQTQTLQKTLPMNVLYGDELTSSQKEIFESQIVSGLIAGKEVLSLYAHLDENGLLRVEISFKDGTSLEKSYAFDPGLLQWNEAKVIKNFSFDNSLQYVRNFSIHTLD